MQGISTTPTSSFREKKSGLAQRKHAGSKFGKLFLFALVFLLLITSLSALYINTNLKNSSQRENLLGSKASNEQNKPTRGANSKINQISPTAIPSPTPTTKPNPTRIPATPTPQEIVERGSATQIDENTWSVQVEPDNRMANVNEIFQALNNYRTKRGVGTLIWDDTLASYAQSRADFFNSQGTLDSHAGFQEYMNNGGFEKSGFNGLGENSAFMAGPMTGTKIIESLFAADPPHDNNQTDPSWTHVGIGLSGNAVNVNFGKDKR